MIILGFERLLSSRSNYGDWNIGFKKIWMFLNDDVYFWMIRTRMDYFVSYKRELENEMIPRWLDANA